MGVPQVSPFETWDPPSRGDRLSIRSNKSPTRETEQSNGNGSQAATSHPASSLEGARDASRKNAHSGFCVRCSPPIPDARHASRSRPPASSSTTPRTASPTKRCSLLLQLAEESGLRERIDAMFRGEKINITENRAVLHVALRAPKAKRILVDGDDVVPRVHDVLDKMAAFCQPRSAAASGKATPASAFATSSTSASAAPISARSWPTRRSSTTATAS